MTEVLVILIAGFGAGIVTGLVGASAVVIVTPFLVTFLGYEPYSAIGISLATDVIASSVSAYTYKKHGNINIRDGLLIAISAVLAAVIGSWLSGGFNSTALGGLTGVIILFTGISFRRKPIEQRAEEFKNKVNLKFLEGKENLTSIVFGGLIGLMTGIFGAGGGVMILMVLTFFLDYKTHIAIGTSVLIMTFTALFGSVSHFLVEQSIPYLELLLSGGAAFAGAVTAASFANKISEKKLSKAIGTAFIFLGIVVVLN